MVTENNMMKNSTSLSQMLFQSMDEAVFVFDIDSNKMEFINSQFIENFGYSENELLRPSLDEVVDNDALQSLVKMGMERSTKMDNSKDHLSLCRRDGSVFYSFYKSSIIQFDGKKYLVGFIQDVSDSLVAEKKLIKVKEEHAQYLEIVGTIIVGINNKKEVTIINKAGRELLGYSEGDIIGKNWFNTFIPQRFRQEVNQVFDSMMDGQIAPTEYFVNPVLRSNGDERIIAWHNTTIRDENGNIMETLSSGEDITERKKIEDELRNSNLEMEQFLYVTANDLYSSITGIDSLMKNMSDLKEKISDQGVLQHCERVNLATQKLKNMVEDLLIYSRVSKSVRFFENVNLNKVVKEVMIDLEDAINLNKAEISFESLHTVRGDAMQIRQVFQNLIGNALKFAKKDIGSQVVISSIDKNDNFIEVTVNDNGIGMSEKNSKKVFNIFHKGPGSEEYSGSGLGLALVKKVIELHGGDIEVNCKIGSGCRFTFTLPKN